MMTDNKTPKKNHKKRPNSSKSYNNRYTSMPVMGGASSQLGFTTIDFPRTKQARKEAALEDTADKWLEDTKDTLGEKSDTFDYCNAAEIVLTNSKKALEENIEIIEKKEYNSGLSEYEEKLKESLVCPGVLITSYLKVSFLKVLCLI